MTRPTKSLGAFGQQDIEVPAPSSTVFIKSCLGGRAWYRCCCDGRGRYSSARDVSSSSPSKASKASKSLWPWVNRKPRPREMVEMEVWFLLCFMMFHDVAMRRVPFQMNYFDKHYVEIDNIKNHDIKSQGDVSVLSISPNFEMIEIKSSDGETKLGSSRFDGSRYLLNVGGEKANLMRNPGFGLFYTLRYQEQVLKPKLKASDNLYFRVLGWRLGLFQQ
jgi:hypothetical protein